MSRIERTRHGAAILVTLTLFSAGCAREPDGSAIEWARAALERNPDLEVVAVDRDAEVFTVRNKRSGVLETVAADAVVARPAASAETPAGAPDKRSSHPTVASAPAPVPEPAAREHEPVAAESEHEPHASDVESMSSENSPEPAARAESRSALPGYTIERADGKVRVSGQGFSIVSAESSGDTLELEARAARSDQPIVCDGPRMMHVDSRTLDVEGDAIVARNGCDLHITNSRIAATGVAVTAIGAKVHVTNSTLDGGLRSLEIAQGGKAYLRSSTLEGTVQRLGSTAEVHDLGGNSW
jgi:hypothetical protein